MAIMFVVVVVTCGIDPVSMAEGDWIVSIASEGSAMSSNL